MKKPKKKEIDFDKPIKLEDRFKVHKDYGYNQACNDWEKFLPGEEEIFQIIIKGKTEMDCLYGETEHKRIATAILKRIKGE